MATDDSHGTLPEAPMPEPDTTTSISAADLCEILATDARRDVIEEIAMRGWVPVDALDPDALFALEEWGVVDIRGETAERGENFAGTLETLNERAKERRDSR